MWNDYLSPATLDDALSLLAERGADARVIAGGTDVVVELHRREWTCDTLVDITNIAGLDSITLDDGRIHIGPLVTHSEVVASELCRHRALPLALACFSIGAPQIRNRGTIAGNIVSASPANDTLPALQGLGAEVTLESTRGRRTVALDSLITGYRQTAMAADELIVDISFAALTDDRAGTFLKLGLRGAQAIAVVNVAVVLTFDDGVVSDASLTLGSVGDTIVRAVDSQQALVGSPLIPQTIADAAARAAAAIEPMSDIRGSAAYRRYMAAVITRHALDDLASGRQHERLPPEPVMLWGEGRHTLGAPDRTGGTSHTRDGGETIDLMLNGDARSVSGANDLTVSQLLRDVAGLPGTKEACWEGECGACTVTIDGAAVASCLVPAPQAHGRRVRTIEGVRAADGGLHRIQRAFIDEGATQCGFCTPGFVMTAAALFAERDRPTADQVRQAVCGNLCRCTTYYPILAALEALGTGDEVPA